MTRMPEEGKDTFLDDDKNHTDYNDNEKKIHLIHLFIIYAENREKWTGF